MGAKTSQLQIRVAPAQKAALKRAARAAGLDLSAYVLARALPRPGGRFTELVGLVGDPSRRSYAYAELTDLLTEAPPVEFAELVASGPPRDMSARDLNYVAALVEQAAALKHVAPPAWAAEVEPLAAPWFASELPALRLHLLRASPAAFKRRNLFVDSGIGARV